MATWEFSRLISPLIYVLEVFSNINKYFSRITSWSPRFGISVRSADQLSRVRQLVEARPARQPGILYHRADYAVNSTLLPTQL